MPFGYVGGEKICCTGDIGSSVLHVPVPPCKGLRLIHLLGIAIAHPNLRAHVPLDSKTLIMGGLEIFLKHIQDGNAPIIGESDIIKYSRKQRTRELADLLNAIVDRSAANSLYREF